MVTSDARTAEGGVMSIQMHETASTTTNRQKIQKAGGKVVLVGSAQA